MRAQHALEGAGQGDGQAAARPQDDGHRNRHRVHRPVRPLVQHQRVPRPARQVDYLRLRPEAGQSGADGNHPHGGRGHRDRRHSLPQRGPAQHRHHPAHRQQLQLRHDGRSAFGDHSHRWLHVDYAVGKRGRAHGPVRHRHRGGRRLGPPHHLVRAGSARHHRRCDQPARVRHGGRLGALHRLLLAPEPVKEEGSL